MMRIPLTQGQFALVDDADYAELSRWKWCARWNKDLRSFYAVRNEPAPNRGTILMHRQILGLAKGDKRQGDHKNHDTLDCQRANLRICTSKQNKFNLRKHRDNKSGYKGVYFSKANAKWAAMICAEGKNKYLGYFPDVVLAAKAYDAAAMKHFGEFALLNFPQEVLWASIPAK